MKKGIRPSHSLAQIKGARLELNSVNVNYSYFATVECIGKEEGYPPPHSLAQINGARLELVNLINFTTWHQLQNLLLFRVLAPKEFSSS